MENINEIFRKTYYNTKNPGSLGGVESLYREVKKSFPTLTKEQVKKWLESQLVYTLHKPVRHKFQRNPMIAEKFMETLQADLVDMSQYSKENDGYKFILTVIDIFSKKSFVIALKNKSQVEVAKAMRKILEKYSPVEIMTDKGKEFQNNLFQKLMKEFEINHYYSNNSSIKCSVVERFNKTLKYKMFKYFTMTGKRRYIDVLNDIVDSYNNSYHRSIKMCPNEVNEENYKNVFMNLYKFKNKREILRKNRKADLPKDAAVRIKYEKKNLDRGFYPNWTDQIFIIYKSTPGSKKVFYHLKTQEGQALKKRFYPEEIQKVRDSAYRIEKILKQRKFRGKNNFS